MNKCSILFLLLNDRSIVNGAFVTKVQKMPTIKSYQASLQGLFAEIDAFVQNLPEAACNARPSEKWSIGEEAEHLITASMGSSALFSSPDERLIPSDHASRDDDALMAEYQEKLPLAGSIGRAIGSKAPTDFAPNDLQNRFLTAAQLLNASLENWDEQKSDAWMVWKHPLLGKMTGREMAAFTVHHTQHHLNSMKKKLENING